MSITFVYRNLTGFYRGSGPNPINDYIKISNMFLEVGKDLASIDARLKTLETNNNNIVTNNNFTTNSISGTVIQQGTLPGTAIQNNSITGDQLVLNSIHGIQDANIAANANINPSKINLSALSHTQIKDIGSNTHPQIDNFINTQNAQNATLTSQISAQTSTISSLNTNLLTLNLYVAPSALSTNSQVVSSAINELYADLQTVGASGNFISGPTSPTFHGIARWGSNNKTLLDSSVTIDDTNNVQIPGSVTFTSTSSTIGTPSTPTMNINTYLVSGYPLSRVQAANAIPITNADGTLNDFVQASGFVPYVNAVQDVNLNNNNLLNTNFVQAQEVHADVMRSTNGVTNIIQRDPFSTNIYIGPNTNAHAIFTPSTMTLVSTNNSIGDVAAIINANGYLQLEVDSGTQFLVDNILKPQVKTAWWVQDTQSSTEYGRFNISSSGIYASGLNLFNGAGISLNNNPITGVPIPVNPSDGVPKSYVDAGPAVPFASGLFAAGSDQTTALLLPAKINEVIVPSGGQGVRLPTTNGGDTIVISCSAVSGLNGIFVYPPFGSEIKAQGTDNAWSLAGGSTISFYSVSPTHWYPSAAG